MAIAVVDTCAAEESQTFQLFNAADLGPEVNLATGLAGATEADDRLP